MDGQLLAVPIDAATPTASYRPDLLSKLGVEVPRTWSQVLDLARRGQVVMPGFHADVFLNFLALSASLDGKIPASAEQLGAGDRLRSPRANARTFLPAAGGDLRLESHRRL
jgi:multiple sugar transport system substrate-binding protein